MARPRTALMCATFPSAARGLVLVCLAAGCAVAGAGEASTPATPASADAMQIHYMLRETEAPPDEASQAVVAPPLAMRGRGAAARIVDATGNEVWHASEATPLYGLHASPDGRRVVTYAGDAN